MNKIETTFLKHLPEESGTGKNGKEWVKNGFVCEDSGQYPVQRAFEIWGEKTSLVKSLKPGDKITVTFDIASREYNGRYFTTVKAIAVDTEKTEPVTTAGGYIPENKQVANDLPF